VSRRRDEQGAAALELVLVAPVLLVMMLLVIGLGRMANARQEVSAVAADAARAASLERNTSMSAAAAKAAAQRSLADGGVSCTGLDVDVDVSAYQPGGQVRVRVACTALLSDVAMSGLPGKQVFTSTSTVPIETYRSR
jgi:Flp pilus assembly protein TadG